MQWQLPFFPTCAYDVFLSHCREDREWLVFPLDRALRRERIAPWLDRHDYPYGRSSLAALRDGVLQCRHTIFLVTRGMLAQPRGWANVELAWADLLQENLRVPGGVLQNVILPLFFLSPSDAALPRSVWQTIRDRAAFHRPEDGNVVAWATRQIRDFLYRESKFAVEVASWLKQDSLFRKSVKARPGLIDRITARHPLLQSYLSS